MIGAFIQINISSERAQSQPIGYVVQENGCWEWVGYKDRWGYGRFNTRETRGKTTMFPVHRFLWEQEHGPVPDGLELDHLCRNTSCVRADHLEAVTHRENMCRVDWSERSAQSQARTHCRRGHELSGENLYFDEGRWKCRTCNRAVQRARWTRKATIKRRGIV